jgi:hypothetical protein
MNTITYQSLLEPNENICVVNNINVDSLSTLNKIVNNKNQKYFELPYANKCFIPQLIDQNMYYLIVCDPLDNSINDEFKVISNYVYLHNDQEIKRYVQVAHEYLINRYETYEYETSIDNTKIDIKPNIGCAYIIINSNKNLKNLTCSIKHENGVVRSYELSTDDPEYQEYKSANDNINTFIIDPYKNISSNNECQPHGVITIMPDSHIELNDAYKIQITYVMFDVIRIIGGLTYLAFNGIDNTIDNQIIEPQNENPDQNPIAIQDIDIPIPIQVPILDDNIETIINYQKLIKMYSESYQKFWNLIGKKIVIATIYTYGIVDMIIAKNNKLLSDENICVVSLEEIKNGEYYYNCEQCNKIFERKTYHNCVMYNKGYLFQCPNCRKTIMSFPELKRNYNFFGLKYGNLNMVFGTMIFIGSYFGYKYLLA